MTRYALTYSGKAVHKTGPVEGRTVCGRIIAAASDVVPEYEDRCSKCFAPHGHCPVCGYQMRLRDGLLPEHLERLVGSGGLVKVGAALCDGGGDRPEEVPGGNV